MSPAKQVSSSLGGLARRPACQTNHIWVGDELLFASFRRFVRHRPQKRCLMSVPGPLEHRNRASRHRLSYGVTGRDFLPVDALPGLDTSWARRGAEILSQRPGWLPRLADWWAGEDSKSLDDDAAATQRQYPPSNPLAKGKWRHRKGHGRPLGLANDASEYGSASPSQTYGPDRPYERLLSFTQAEDATRFLDATYFIILQAQIKGAECAANDFKFIDTLVPWFREQLRLGCMPLWAIESSVRAIVTLCERTKREKVLQNALTFFFCSLLECRVMSLEDMSDTILETFWNGLLKFRLTKSSLDSILDMLQEFGNTRKELASRCLINLFGKLVLDDMCPPADLSGQFELLTEHVAHWTKVRVAVKVIEQIERSSRCYPSGDASLLFLQERLDCWLQILRKKAEIWSSISSYSKSPFPRLLARAQPTLQLIFLKHMGADELTRFYFRYRVKTSERQWNTCHAIRHSFPRIRLSLAAVLAEPLQTNPYLTRRRRHHDYLEFLERFDESAEIVHIIEGGWALVKEFPEMTRDLVGLQDTEAYFDHSGKGRAAGAMTVWLEAHADLLCRLVKSYHWGINAIRMYEEAHNIGPPLLGLISDERRNRQRYFLSNLAQAYASSPRKSLERAFLTVGECLHLYTQLGLGKITREMSQAVVTAGIINPLKERQPLCASRIQDIWCVVDNSESPEMCEHIDALIARARPNPKVQSWIVPTADAFASTKLSDRILDAADEFEAQISAKSAVQDPAMAQWLREASSRDDGGIRHNTYYII